MLINTNKAPMKKLAYLFTLCVLLADCKDKTKFTITGTFKNAQPQSKVYLYGQEGNKPVALDSTVFSEKGEFQFTKSTKGVDFFKISAGHNEYVVIAKNGDNIKISADLTDESMNYTLSGADEADKLQELNTTKNKYTAKMAELQKQFEELVEKEPQNREMIANQMRPELTKRTDSLLNFVLNFALTNPKSLASFYAINSLNPSDYEKEFLEYADKIKSNFNENAAVTDFLVRMAKLKSVQVGQVAPAFTMNSIDGKPVKLADFKGKYVLLDFWASWCLPCRHENPNVVKAYHTFKDKNFTVFSISLDKDPVAWKQAVNADHLDWTHASELKDFEGPTVRLYQVEGIPSSFLLDPSGKIIAKNLRGEDLNNFLNKTLR